MHVLVKGEVLEFIVPGGANNWIVLYELRKYLFEVVVMY